MLQDQITDYDRYASGQLKVIGYPDHPRSDCTVMDKLSYPMWINDYTKYPVIKVEGLESLELIRGIFPKLKTKSIHLFVNQRYGYSFNWHRDDCNVFLFVIKGQKTAWVRDRRYILNPGQGVMIPKGHLHRVRSIANTWALSIGIK